MAKQVQIRRGPLSNLITLVEGELGFVTDTKELVVGASGGNQFMAKKTHQHAKADIVDFAHQHGKADIVDFPVSLPASDVYSWAKQANKPSYAYSEITGRPTLGTVAPINLPQNAAKYLRGDGTWADGGADAHVHIRYADSPTPGTSIYSTPTGHDYIGFYSGVLVNAPTDGSLYTWAKFVGTDGADGGGIIEVTGAPISTEQTVIVDGFAVQLQIYNYANELTTTKWIYKDKTIAVANGIGGNIQNVSIGITFTAEQVSIVYVQTGTSGTPPSNLVVTYKVKQVQ